MMSLLNAIIELLNWKEEIYGKIVKKILTNLDKRRLNYAQIRVTKRHGSRI